jgi:hypothetical protein
VKARLNMGGPSSKPKYYRKTDSELVPRGKGEKYPEQGDETDPEIMCLQAVGAAQAVTAYLLYNGSASDCYVQA